MFHVGRRVLSQTCRAYCSQVSASQSVLNTNVPGLSEKCVKIPNTAVGPNASKQTEYKNPEYFCYNVDTIGESEVELAKYRLPAPSNKK